MRQGGIHVLDLVCALATNLPRRFHDCEQPVHAGMAIGQPAAVGVDRQLATRADAPIRHEPSALALWTEAQILKEEDRVDGRSEEHTSELQSLMRISYAVFCLKKKNRSDADATLQRKYHH